MDTVVLRLHNLKKYHWFVNQIVSLTAGYHINNEFVEVSTPLQEKFKNLLEKLDKGIAVDKDDIIEIYSHKHDRLNAVSDFLHMKTVLFSDTNNKRNAAYRRKHKMKSSNYDLTTYVCFDRDYIEWNFSIPKFLYGTNVYQFVPHGGERIFEGSTTTYSAYKKILYKKFMYFIKCFFTKNFIYDGDNKINRMDLELNRIDFSWNCVFDTPNDALTRLSYIKKMKLKGIRQDTEIGGDWGTTHMIVTDGYSRKVYHKGSEFAKNDYKELLKNNTFSDEHLQRLQRFADRILRFEVTLRVKHMSYLYQRNLWRKNSVGQNAMRSRAKEGRKFLEAKNKSFDEYLELTKKFTKEFVDSRIQDYQTQLACDNYRRAFVFGENEGCILYNNEFSEIPFNRAGEVVLNKEVCLNEEIFLLWHDVLEQFIVQTEVRDVPAWDSLEEKIKEHNDAQQSYKRLFGTLDLKQIGAGKKINEKRIFRYLAILQKYSVEEIFKFNLIERTTYWRLKKDLEKFGYKVDLGIEKQVLAIDAVPDFIKPIRAPDGALIREEGGFREYYNFIFSTLRIFNKEYC